MGALIDTDCASRVAALHAELSRRAKVLQRERGGAAAVRGGDADARIGACRADALAAAILGTDPDNPGTAEPAVPALEGHLVIDLPTLQGLLDHPCLLNGQPIPAPVGRELAASVKAWRRFVTDPVTGHLLDYGTRTYLPEPLLRFTAARDGVCAAPYCERPASRCQMDHRLAFPDGPSSAANCGLFCDRHHPLKTAGLVTVSESKADGTLTWTTPWGQVTRTTPRPVIDNPDPAEQCHDVTDPDPPDTPAGNQPVGNNTLSNGNGISPPGAVDPDPPPF
jgi:hypothetical protein